MRFIPSVPSRRRAAGRALLAGLGLGLLSMVGCGRPDGLVLVHVSGLEAAITELHVTMTLDGTQATNSQPTADDPNSNTFSVYKDMQDFGVQVPSGTQQLALAVDGLNTSLVVIKSGSGQLDVTQKQDLDLALH